MEIKHLRNNSIDYELWDLTISKSLNSLSYAYSWFLDIVSPGWEALVTENYDYIMPLPAKCIYGMHYIVQPVLTQQLGIFSRYAVGEKTVKEFINAIPYVSYEFNLNEGNIVNNLVTLPNYILNLNQPYLQLSDNFSKNNRRNIDKASKLNLELNYNLTLKDFMQFYQSVERNYISAQFSVVEKLIETGLTEGCMHLYGVYSSGKEMIAALCMMYSGKRMTYLLPISNQEGKSSSAMFLLIDKLIQNNAGEEKIFDFEGSRIEGIARFYKGFGAKNQPYCTLKRFRPTFLIGRISKK